jgi:thiosulfate/3-mercaptopyruvate sulfurtransferase
MAALVVKDILLHLKTTDKLAKIFGGKGITRDSEIITYGEKSEYYAIYINWILEHLGANKVRFYNDGIDGAKQANIELTTKPTVLDPTVFEPKYRDNLITSTDAVIENKKSGKATLIDIRPKSEVFGDDIRSLRGGKIPGAIHLDIENNWVDMETKDLKSVAELNDIYSCLDQERDIILTCQIGIRTTYVYYILKALGFTRMSNHEDSWIIWGNRFDLPIEHGRSAKLGKMARGDLLRSIAIYLKNIPRMLMAG